MAMSPDESAPPLLLSPVSTTTGVMKVMAQQNEVSHLKGEMSRVAPRFIDPLDESFCLYR